jgi:capsular polysaccharide biosynthesis protein
MENQQYLQENEIDLRDYINVVIKRKILILSIFLIAVVTAAIVSLLMPKVYEITSTVQLGNVNGLLISKEEAREIILNQNLLLSVVKKLNLKIDLENLKKNIKINDINGTNLLKIKIERVDIDTAFKINDAILNPLITQGQGIYQERLSLVNERLNELDAEIKNAEGDIGRTQNLISGLPNSNNISQSDISLRIILLQNTLPNYESNLTVLRNQRNGLKLSLAIAKDFKVFDSPIKPKYPVGPKKKQNVLIAGMLSLMLGVFLAFFAEYWKKSKSQK